MFEIYNALLRRFPLDKYDTFNGQGNTFSTTIFVLVSAIQKCAEIAPGHTRVYLQAVANDCVEMKPLVAQLTELTKQRGIMILSE